MNEDERAPPGTDEAALPAPIDELDRSLSGTVARLRITRANARSILLHMFRSPQLGALLRGCEGSPAEIENIIASLADQRAGTRAFRRELARAQVGDTSFFVFRRKPKI